MRRVKPLRRNQVWLYSENSYEKLFYTEAGFLSFIAVSFDDRFWINDDIIKHNKNWHYIGEL